MQFSNERIQEFRNTIEKEYGKKMSWEEATEGLENLVGCFDLLLKMDKRQNPERYESKR